MKKIIENWNMKVAPNDTIYHLGGFGFQSKLGEEYNLHSILQSLNGQKHLIIGNHDSVQNMKGWSTINELLVAEKQVKTAGILNNPLLGTPGFTLNKIKQIWSQDAALRNTVFRSLAPMREKISYDKILF